jgi:hypothetical protein
LRKTCKSELFCCFGFFFFDFSLIFCLRYALSLEQRDTLKKYQKKVDEAREARLLKKSPQLEKKPVVVKKKERIKVVVEDEGAKQRRAERQEQLFKQHDLEREDFRQTLGHSDLRELGAPLNDCDVERVVFGSGEKLCVGQIVAVPKSKGGFVYGQIAGSVQSEHCFFSNRHQHVDQLIKVKYGKLQKVVPPILLGRLPAAPSASSLELIPVDYSIGDSMVPEHAAHMQMGPQCRFEAGEFVAVPRSKGGFTIGQIAVVKALRCPAVRKSGESHALRGYLVITDEADDEGEAQKKAVLAALLGKSPVFGGVQTPPTLSSASSLANDSPAEVEAQLRERFGDFTPFLDDEEEDDLIPLEALEETDLEERFSEAEMEKPQPSATGVYFEPLFG